MLFPNNFYYILPIFASILTTILLFLKYRNTFWKRNGIEQLEPTLFFGDMKDIVFLKRPYFFVYQDMYNYFKKLKLEFGGFYFMYKPELLIISPELVKDILVKDFDHFTDHAQFSEPTYDFLTAGVFTARGEEWKILRQKLAPSFTGGKIQKMFDLLVNLTKNLKDVLNVYAEKEEAFPAKDICARYATDVIGSYAFGINCNSLQKSDDLFTKYGRNYITNNTIIFLVKFLFVYHPKIAMALKIPSSEKKTREFYLNLIKDIITYREENKISRNDLFQFLMELRQTNRSSNDENFNMEDIQQEKTIKNKPLTIEEIVAQCFQIFLGGFETISTTFSFVLFELAYNIDIQEKARQEVIKILEKHNTVTYDAAMEMEYLEKVINECLRKYPPLANLTRICSKDYALPRSNYVVKKGQILRIPVFAISRDPDYYSDPEKFDPGRFSEEEKRKRPSFSFLTFGGGPRICIGSRFAMIEIKTALCFLLKNFTFTLSSKTKIPLEFDVGHIVLGVKGDIWLNIKKYQS